MTRCSLPSKHMNWYEMKTLVHKPRNSIDLMVPQVDKHIRRLDSDLARFENEIKDKSSVAVLSAEEDSSSTAKSSLISTIFSTVPCFLILEINLCI